jgi:hypothetical protein
VVVQQMPVIGFMMMSALPGSAKNGHTCDASNIISCLFLVAQIKY